MANEFGQKTGTGSQTIQTSRGNIIKRNESKVLARGELFIQTTDVLDTTKVKTLYNVKLSDSDLGSPYIYDMGTKSYIHSFFQGDLFAGTGQYGKVWSLGSGGALKWGGVSGANDWAALKAAGKLKPNHIFMYIGSRPIENPTDGQTASDRSIEGINEAGIRDRAPGTRGTAPVDVESRYVGYDPTESAEIINPGDLFFYSPVYDENVVIHLSHSSDALTKINQFALVSESMKGWFAKLLGTENTRFATLKDFLDGPVRRYQSLIGEEGWNPITTTPVAEQTDADKSDHIIGCNPITPTDTAFANTDFDGAIHYIPFENGRKRIPFDDGTDRYTTGVNRLHEGDLILSIPTVDGGIEYSVISLYGKLLDQLSARNLNFTRADPYAESIWNNETATEDYDTDEDFKAKLENTITEYIKRLYLTKVDLDPTTKKIISSQLPDFLLGAPKFMRVLKAEDATVLSGILNPGDEDPDNPSTIPANAHDIAKVWTTGFANIDANVDKEDTDTKESEASTAYDTKLQAGSYWIWNGGHFVIDELGDYFNLNEKDDYDPTGNENKGEFVHALENGDWIVYNGENQKFDILDNSSSFVGILMDGVKLSGTPEFTDVQRVIKETDWDGKPVEASGDEAPHEVKLNPKSITELEFSNPNSVIFKKDGANGDPFVDENHVPVISNKGTAKNSRWQLTDKQAGVNLPATQADDATPQLSSIKFLFSKYINEAVDQYTTTLAGSDELNIEFWEANNTEHKYVLHGFGRKENSLPTTTSNTVLDLQEFNFTNESELDANGVGKYKFEILGEKDPVLELPTHSGILATERYVDSGFVVVKKVIEDLYEEIIKQTTSGHIDWLQTLVPAATLNGKKLYDSRVQQILTRSEDTTVADRSAVDNLGFGFYLVKSFDDNGDIKFNDSLYTKLIVKKILTESDGPIDLKITEGNGQVHTYNPKELETGHPVENVLPNHGGTLLNNNSVIDGGEFI